jgi:hypothetical protein
MFTWIILAVLYVNVGFALGQWSWKLSADQSTLPLNKFCRFVLWPGTTFFPSILEGEKRHGIGIRLLKDFQDDKDGLEAEWLQPVYVITMSFIWPLKIINLPIFLMIGIIKLYQLITYPTRLLNK